MKGKMTTAAICAFLLVALGSALAFGRGGGGFRGGYGGGFHGGYGGFRGGEGGMRYGGASSFSRTPSFSSAHSYDRYGGYGGGYESRGAAEGMHGGQLAYGSRSGSYTTARGGTVDYGAAGAAGRGPGGAAAGRGVYGVSGTTAGGRSYADVGRAGGAVGPGGNAVAGRSNIAAASGPRGTAVEGSRGFAAAGGGGAYAGRSYGASAYRPSGYNAYGAYHSGWVHGYWNGHDSAAWGWHSPYWGGTGVGLGMGLGWGLSSWGFGSSLYGMGYMPYTNPYYYGATAGAAGQADMSAPYNYSQPINTVSAPADQAVADPAMSLFDAGRASFKDGSYAEALQKTNDALAKLPTDTTLHEFRGLCLFALGRYDESAATLYAVLAVGPGWDWTTLISLYPSVDVYSAQLGTLEEFTRAHSDSATARFVLVYHYLTEGFTDAAVQVLKQLVALKPSDSVAAKLLHQLDPPKNDPAKIASTAVTDTTPPQGASIAGTWNAQPSADTSILLDVKPGGAFIWQAAVKGQQRQFAGVSTYGDGILTLAQDKGPALVGRVGWKDASHMNFHVVGDGPDDPGLSFTK